MAAGDFTTLTAARDYLRLEDPLDDAWIESLISSSSAWIVEKIGWSPLSAQYTDTVDGDGEKTLHLKHYVVPRRAAPPPLSVQSVTVGGVVIPPRTTGDGWFLRDGGTVELVGSSFTEGVPQNVVVAYTMGYATVPQAIAQATLKHVAVQYHDRDWSAATVRITSGDVVDHRGATPAGAWPYILGVIEDYQMVGGPW